MYRYDDVALAALLMFVPIEATSLLGQPFSKCCAFHCCAPVDDVGRAPQPDLARFPPQIATLVATAVAGPASSNELLTRAADLDPYDRSYRRNAT
jgi:hypothetical protein